MESYAAFMLNLEFSLKYNIGLQESKSEFIQKLYLLHYCNRLLMESHLNFDKSLRY